MGMKSLEIHVLSSTCQKPACSLLFNIEANQVPKVVHCVGNPQWLLVKLKPQELEFMLPVTYCTQEAETGIESLWALLRWLAI